MGMAAMTERVGKLETRMERVEEGIANFRVFQGDARDFFSRADERAISDKEHRDKRDEEIKNALHSREHSADHKLNVIMAVVAILGALTMSLTLLLGYLTFRDTVRKNSFAEPVSQSRTQDTGIPINP